MRNLNVEAVFGGILALVVIGVAMYAVTDTTFGGVSVPKPGPSTPATTTTASVPINSSAPRISSVAGQDLVCECYNDAFDLAGKVKVLSPDYRTGFEQCRARGGVDGGDAWTAGWNARLSSKPFESSCRSYKRRR